jgi:hypothetical protein
MEEVDESPAEESASSEDVMAAAMLWRSLLLTPENCFIPPKLLFIANSIIVELAPRIMLVWPIFP